MHLFWLEAMALAWHHFCKLRQKHLEQDDFVVLSWSTLFLAVADTSFIAGSIIETTISYVWLLDVDADYNAALNRADVTAEALWVVCSFIYVVQTILGEVSKRRVLIISR